MSYLFPGVILIPMLWFPMWCVHQKLYELDYIWHINMYIAFTWTMNCWRYWWSYWRRIILYSFVTEGECEWYRFVFVFIRDRRRVRMVTYACICIHLWRKGVRIVYIFFCIHSWRKGVQIVYIYFCIHSWRKGSANGIHVVTPRSHGYGDVTATYIRRSEVPSRIYAKHQYNENQSTTNVASIHMPT